MPYKNHLKIGSTKATHKSKEVVTSIHSQEFEEAIHTLRNLPFQIGVIPPGYEHRADKISDLFYGTPTLDWVILWANNISDPFQQLNAGDRIKIVSIT